MNDETRPDLPPVDPPTEEFQAVGPDDYQGKHRQRRKLPWYTIAGVVALTLAVLFGLAFLGYAIDNADDQVPATVTPSHTTMLPSMVTTPATHSMTPPATHSMTPMMPQPMAPQPTTMPQPAMTQQPVMQPTTVPPMTHTTQPMTTPATTTMPPSPPPMT